MQLPRKLIFLLSCFIFVFQYSFSQYIPFFENGKWGFASTSGRITIPCIYDEVEFFSTDHLAKVKLGGKYGYINIVGKEVIPTIYDECHRTLEVIYNENPYYIRLDSLIHINPIYTYNDLDSNWYILSQNNKFGVFRIDKGVPKELIPFNYSKIQYNLNKKVFYCWNGKDVKYMNTLGEVIELEETDEEEFSHFAPPINEKKPEIYKSSEKVGVALVNRFFKTEKVTIILDVMYEDIMLRDYNQRKVNYSNSDVFGVKLDGKWGIVNANNKLLVPTVYDSLNMELSNSDLKRNKEYQYMFIVKEKKYWGLLAIAQSDSLVTLLPFDFDAITKMNDSYLSLRKRKKFMVYSKKSNGLISEKSYSSLKEYKNKSVQDFEIFEVTNKKGQTVYLGENGVEFFKD